jgi:CheY-like chemotaxis protein
LLVVEDDPVYANVLVDLAHEQGFQVVRATRGAEALALARDYRPTAISLDINLPDMHGWAVLCQLKDDPSTRHIPVQIVTLEEDQQHGLTRGAFAFVTKSPTTDALKASLTRIKEYSVARRKRLLVVEDDETSRLSIVELLAHDDIEISVVDTGVAALEALGEHAFDCAVVDLRLPDMSGFALLAQIHENPALRGLPIVVYTGRELSAEEDAQLQRLAKSVVLKGVESPERLLDETALFLHRRAADLPEAKREIVEKLHRSEDLLAGKKVLLVDDDIRNIFAMTSVLERHRMHVVAAENGKEAVELVQSENPDVVLMDIMLPEMDGYETTRAIRQIPRFRGLPIIALTAKAMRGDRERCLEAGASDYIAKPVDTDQLLALLRTWLYR